MTSLRDMSSDSPQRSAARSSECLHEDGSAATGRLVRVSVIIPAYNAAAFLHQSIKSALSQTGVRVEVVVVDDGSTDATGDIVRDWSAKDRRVIGRRQPTSLGPAAARNKAIKAASGEWIALLDADDEFADGRLSKLVQAAEARGLDVIADNQIVIDSAYRAEGSRAFDERLMAQSDLLTLESLLLNDWPGRSLNRPLGNLKPIMRRSTLEDKAVGYDERFRLGEDFFFYALLLLHGVRFGFHPEPLYIYNLRSGSASNGSASRLQELVGVNRCLLDVVDAARRSRNDQSPAASVLLRQREHALRYQWFARSVKERNLTSTVEAFSGMSKAYAVVHLSRALARRAGRLGRKARRG